MSSNNPYEPRPDDNPHGQSGSNPPEGYGQPSGTQPGEPYAQPPYSQPPTGNPYGQPTANPYGTDPYGQAQQSPYGQPPVPSPYGQAYGGPVYGSPYGVAAQPHPQGTVVLVLGIVGLVACPLVASVVAWVMGSKALKEIDANPTAYSNRQNVQIGRILGIIGTLLYAVVIVVYVILAIVLVASTNG